MTKKKKILFLLHLPPPVHGASMVGQYIRDSKLLREAFECRFLKLSTSTSNDQIGKGGFKKVSIFLKTFFTLKKLVTRQKFDLVYVTFSTTGAGLYKDFILVRLIKHYQKNILYHFHNKGVKENSKRWLNDKIYHAAFRNTKAVLLSQRLYEDISGYFSKDRVFYCPNGIPDGPSRETTEVTPDRKSKILFLSNIIIEKGVFVLMDACSILADKGLNFHCDFIGDWAEITPEEFIQNLCQRKISSYVTGHGKKYGAEKNAFFEQANIFVLPTYYKKECFPLVLLEAMKYSLPLISTDEGGIADIIDDGETGVIVEKQSAEKLAYTLEVLIRDPKLQKRYGMNSRRKFEMNYTLSIFEKNLEIILSRVV